VSIRYGAITRQRQPLERPRVEWTDLTRPDPIDPTDTIDTIDPL